MKDGVKNARTFSFVYCSFYRLASRQPQQWKLLALCWWPKEVCASGTNLEFVIEFVPPKSSHILAFLAASAIILKKYRGFFERTSFPLWSTCPQNIIMIMVFFFFLPSRGCSTTTWGQSLTNFEEHFVIFGRQFSSSLTRLLILLPNFCHFY